MKPHHIFMLSAVFVVAQAAAADETTPDPKVLGTTEAILAYCAKIDRAGESKYRERIKLVTQSSSDEALAKVRESDEYQEARQSVDDSVAKTDEHHAMKACSDFLTQK
jgi:hypothetical protein